MDLMAGARPLLLVTGIADGLGASVAATFALAGYDILGLARSNKAAVSIGRVVAAMGGDYTHLVSDVTKAADVATALEP